MKYEYLALDFDGTLLTSAHTIDPKTYEALMHAQQSGTQLILASGRPTFAMTEFAKQLEVEKFGGYLLSFNGAYMFDLATQTRISATELTATEVFDLYTYSQNFEFSTLIYDETTILTDAINEHSMIEANITGMAIAETTDFNRASAKIIFVHSGEYLDTIEAQVQAEIGDRFTVSRSLPCFLEVTPKGVDKGASLTTLFELINADAQTLIACGDGGNDLTMIEFAGLGVAMDNARPNVKLAADYITADNDSCGIAEVVHTFLLNQL